MSTNNKYIRLVSPVNQTSRWENVFADPIQVGPYSKIYLTNSTLRIASGIFTIDATNNIFQAKISIGLPAFSDVTLTPGNYTKNELMIELKRALNSILIYGDGSNSNNSFEWSASINAFSKLDIYFSRLPSVVNISAQSTVLSQLADGTPTITFPALSNNIAQNVDTASDYSAVLYTSRVVGSCYRTSLKILATADASQCSEMYIGFIENNSYSNVVGNNPNAIPFNLFKYGFKIERIAGSANTANITFINDGAQIPYPVSPGINLAVANQSIIDIIFEQGYIKIYRRDDTANYMYRFNRDYSKNYQFCIAFKANGHRLGGANFANTNTAVMTFCPSPYDTYDLYGNPIMTQLTITDPLVLDEENIDGLTLQAQSRPVLNFSANDITKQCGLMLGYEILRELAYPQTAANGIFNSDKKIAFLIANPSTYLVTLPNFGQMQSYDSLAIDTYTGGKNPIICHIPESQINENSVITYSPPYPIKISLNNKNTLNLNSIKVELQDELGVLLPNEERCSISLVVESPDAYNKE